MLWVDLVQSRSLSVQHIRGTKPCVSYCPLIPTVTRKNAFRGPVSHHLCRECIKSIFSLLLFVSCSAHLFLSFLYLVLYWCGYIIIVALICLSPTSPLLSFCCIPVCLWFSISVHAGSWCDAELCDLRLFSFSLCLLIYSFLFLSNIISLPSKVLLEFDLVS